MPGGCCGAASRRQWSISSSPETRRTQLECHPGAVVPGLPAGTQKVCTGRALSSAEQLQSWRGLSQLLRLRVLH